MSPGINPRDVSDLALLTIGSQFQGGNNVAKGRQAIEALLLSVREIVKSNITGEEKNRITVQNSAGRVVTLSFGADPDLRIQEELEPGKIHNKVAVEVKGGDRPE